MGKKKKTKEIREVVGEASSEQQTQPRRKRGRPRKIIENTQVTIEAEEEKNQAEEQKEEKEEEAVAEESESKRMKSSSDVEQPKGIRSVSSSLSIGDAKGGAGPSDESKTEEPPKSRRRKSQPRKSSN